MVNKIKRDNFVLILIKTSIFIELNIQCHLMFLCAAHRNTSLRNDIKVFRELNLCIWKRAHVLLSELNLCISFHFIFWRRKETGKNNILSQFWFWVYLHTRCPTNHDSLLIVFFNNLLSCLKLQRIIKNIILQFYYDKIDFKVRYI